MGSRPRRDGRRSCAAASWCRSAERRPRTRGDRATGCPRVPSGRACHMPAPGPQPSSRAEADHYAARRWGEARDDFYAFEMERRGAREVVALDLPDLADIDYPPEVRADSTFDPSAPSDVPRQAGFHLLHEALGSSVQLRLGSIYDLASLGLGS